MAQRANVWILYVCLTIVDQVDGEKSMVTVVETPELVWLVTLRDRNYADTKSISFFLRV